MCLRDLDLGQDNENTPNTIVKYVTVTVVRLQTPVFSFHSSTLSATLAVFVEIWIGIAVLY